MAFKFIEIKDLSEQELLGVIEENAKEAVFTREEIRKLKQAAKPKTPAPTIVIDNSKTEEDVVDRSDFEDEVEYYYSQIREITQYDFNEKINLCIPTRNNRNYEKIILRLKLEAIRSIREINEVISEFSSMADKEEIQMFKEEIEFERKKIAYYDNLLSPVKEEVEEIIEEEPISNRMIFVSTNGGNVRIFDEIDHIPDTFYESFLELFLSIKDGSFKNVKRFTNNAALAGLVEVKNPQVRVVFARLNENTYAIITAFIKKTQRDKGYLDSLKGKASDYKAIAELLKRNLNNPEFLELHQQYEDELLRKLGYDPVTKTFIKGGK